MVRFIFVYILLKQKIMNSTLIIRGEKPLTITFKRRKTVCGSGTKTNYSNSTSQKGWLCSCFAVWWPVDPKVILYLFLGGDNLPSESKNDYMMG